MGPPALERGCNGLQKGAENSKWGAGRPKRPPIKQQPGAGQERTHRCSRPAKLHNLTEEPPQ